MAGTGEPTTLRPSRIHLGVYAVIIWMRLGVSVIQFIYFAKGNPIISFVSYVSFSMSQ